MTANRSYETELLTVGQMALEVASAPPEADIYAIIAGHVLSLSSALYVEVAEYDPQNQSLVLSGYSAMAEVNDIIAQLSLGGVGKCEIPVGPDTYDELLRCVVRLSDDFLEQATPGLSEGIWHELEKRWNALQLQQIALINAKNILGAITVVYPHDAISLGKESAEAVAHITALLLRERKSQVDRIRLESRYMELTDLLPEVVFETNLDGNLTFANNSACSIFGYDRKDFLSELRLMDLVAAVDTDRMAEDSERIVRGKDIGPKEYLLRRKDGSKLPARVSSNVVIQNGQPVGLRGIIIDLSKSRRVEQEYAQLVAAIEQTAESIIITDSIARIIYVNPAFIKTTGIKAHSIIGNLLTLLTESEGEATEGKGYLEMWQTLRNGESWYGLFTNHHPDGSMYTLDATINPVRSSDGTITNYVAALRDVTYEKQLEERYRQSQKMEAVGRLAGGIAHDFNNLMTAISGYATVLDEGMVDTDRRRKDVKEILHAVDRATKLTGQLLTFSRKQVFKPTELNIHQILAKMDNLLRRLIGEDIALEYNLCSDLPHVYADSGQIEQVIMNLVVNARDAMPTGGKLLFRTRTVSNELGDLIHLIVEDTGTGIEDELLDQIFEPFFTTKRVGEGTGLGLSTVYGIVSQSGGSISVSSPKGGGAVFTVELPAATEPMSIHAETPERIEELSGTEAILLVEDESLVRNLAERVLTKKGYGVISAEHPEEAMRIVGSLTEPIDLLITDVVMPVMTGEELARSITDLHPTTKVLFMSGYTNKAISSRGMRDGSAPFLQKPFSPADLLQAVRGLLDKF